MAGLASIVRAETEFRAEAEPERMYRLRRIRQGYDVPVH